MRPKFIVLLSLIIFIAGAGCNKKQNTLDLLKNATWIDLTHSFENNSVYWPTNISFTHDTVFEGMTEKGYYYSSFKYSAEEHGGTHFDAPMHFAKGGKSVDQVPVQQLIGEGVVIDVREKASANRDYQVTIDDFEKWEEKYGRIPENAIVLINTGFSKYYPDKLSYTGTTLPGKEGVENLHFPGLHPDAANFLATQRKINAVGLDTPSIDFGQSKEFLTHRTLFANNITAYENVAGLEQLPAKGSWIFAFPMKIKGGSGAPLRLVAMIPVQ
ncbi:MAG: cyclase family protein [Bacteroidales bacterium]